MRALTRQAPTIALVASCGVLAAVVSGAGERAPVAAPTEYFATSDRCIACHNGITTTAGQDASIGFDWRASIMANSARDPYWQASVRREVLDHPSRRADIEDECSICHMPMQRFTKRIEGGQGEVFTRFPFRRGTDRLDSLSADGVSCTVCHQIQKTRLGEHSSFTGGFVLDASTPMGKRPIFGPYPVEEGHRMVMHSSSGFIPREADHIRQSELCATCHTLYTTAFDEAGKVVGQLPEQMPFLEWRHSDYRGQRSCQSCHMPLVVAPQDSVPITSIAGDPRPDVRRHWFPGGNFFMLAMLNRYRAELAVEALPQELMNNEARTRDILAQAARLKLSIVPDASGLVVDVTVTNLNGHKLPTAYPSRRAWLHVTVRDRGGAPIFESGAITPSGRIIGNDNDDDRTRFEPHYREITAPGQVQIYESILQDFRGMVTTGLLSAVGYVKDNRLLPTGFDKRSADRDIEVVGDAASDPSFVGGSHRTRYRIPTAGGQAPYRIEAELLYQPIGFRWAQNLRLQPALETDRFVAYYESMSHVSSTALARDSLTVP